MLSIEFTSLVVWYSLYGGFGADVSGLIIGTILKGHLTQLSTVKTSRHISPLLYTHNWAAIAQSV